jgi:hypothetical protein
MDITKLTDNSNVLALLSGEKEIDQYSEKDQKEAISILNDSPSLMMKYLSLVFNDDLELYRDDFLKIISPKLRFNVEILEYTISYYPSWLSCFCDFYMEDNIISDKHILASLSKHIDICDDEELDHVLRSMDSTHISNKFIFDIIKVDSLNPMNVICSTIANLDLSKTEISDKAIMAILVELRRNIEEHTQLGTNSIVYGDMDYFYHWTERMGGVDDFNEFVKAITARSSKKITSELGLLKNCFEEYFKMLKKENIEDYVEEPIQAWIDAFEK